jgi:hypothetical protein
MSEKGMRQRVVKALKGLDAISVENPAYPGTPDVNYIGGWLELKWKRCWPKGVDTPLKMPHFTPQQKVWLTRRSRKGGAAFVLLQVGQEYLLLMPDDAADFLGNSPMWRLRKLAIWSGEGHSSLNHLKTFLQHHGMEDQ